MIHQTLFLLIFYSTIYLVLVLIIAFIYLKLKCRKQLISILIFICPLIVNLTFFIINPNNNFEDIKIFLIILLNSIYIVDVLLYFLIERLNDKLLERRISNNKRKQNIFYIELNASYKISEISPNIAQEIGYTPAKGLQLKSFLTLLNKNVRPITLNGLRINDNEQLIKELYNNKNKEIEFSFLNKKEKNCLINFSIIKYRKISPYPTRRKTLLLGTIKFDEDNNEVGTSIKELEQKSDNLSRKLLSFINLSNQGIFTLDAMAKKIWINDLLANSLHLKKNNLTLKEFSDLVYADDFAKLLQSIDALTTTNSFLKIVLRIKVDTQFIWYDFQIKKIFEDNSFELLALVNKAQTSSFIKTNSEFIDNLQSIEGFNDTLESIKNEQKIVICLLVRLNNISKINYEYSRKVGDFILSDYISSLNQTFTSANNYIYRISGADFLFIVTDLKKESIIKQAFTKQLDFLSFTKSYGSLNPTLLVKASATYVKPGLTSQEVLVKLYQALQIACDINIEADAIFYEDIK